MQQRHRYALAQVDAQLENNQLAGERRASPLLDDSHPRGRSIAPAKTVRFSRLGCGMSAVGERLDSSSAWLWPTSGAFHRSYENDRVFVESPPVIGGRCAGQHSVRQRQARAGFMAISTNEGMTLVFFSRLLYSEV